jgi:hypothetical protein
MPSHLILDTEEDAADLDRLLPGDDGTPVAGRRASEPAVAAVPSEGSATGGWTDAPAELRRGTEVVDPAGEKVGELFALHPEGEIATHLIVHTGWLFVKGDFVPVETVTSIADDRIVLAVDKDRLEEQGWDVVPDDD